MVLPKCLVMNDFYVAFLKLKKCLRHKQGKSIHVRTYAGDFTALNSVDNKRASYGDYEQYIETNHGLKLVQSSRIQVMGGKLKKNESIEAPENIRQFTQTISASCLAVAKFMAILRSSVQRP